MDGLFRLIISIFISLIFISCQKNESNEVTAYKNDNSSAGFNCPTSKLNRNKFIVQYLDGRIEIVEAENDAVFEKNFLNHRFNEIKRVEYDSYVDRGSTQFRMDFKNTKIETLRATDWGPQMIKAEYAWSRDIRGQGVKVAVIDAAVDFKHSQLRPRLLANQSELNGISGVDDDRNGFIDDVYGWDFYRNEPTSPVDPPLNPGDEPNVHGSHVAGIILADHETGDVQGVAPKASLVPLNFMSDQGGGSVSDAILAIQYAASQGVKIINASWGGGCNQNLKDVIANIGQRGILFVAAAGNEGYDLDRVPEYYYNYPAAFTIPQLISVAATTSLDSIAIFSNKSHSLVHIGAPGENIRSTVPTFASPNGSGYLDGTSMAAPFVSGAAALLWSTRPSASVAQIRQALQSSTDFKAFKVSTGGRLNIEKAVQEIQRIVP